MQTILRNGLIAAALLATPAARAWTYQDGDALLIFREGGYNDVEFDIGPVTQFLNHANGFSAPITNWDLSVVQGVFGNDLTGVSVIVAATTPATNTTRTAWLSSSVPNTTAYAVTPSGWQGSLWSTINSIGTRPLVYDAPEAGLSSYSIDPSGSYRIASYDQIVSQNGVNAASIAELGGNSKFDVEGVAPGAFYFWAIQPSLTNPKPPDVLVGVFNIAAGGQLTFVAGAPAPVIESFGAAGGVESVTFDTTLGGNYWLAATNQLGGPLPAWPTVSGPIAGTGSQVTLTDTNTASAGFYGVVRTP
jgi:hypothetical protein